MTSSTSSVSMLIPLQNDLLDLPSGRTGVISSGRGDWTVMFFPAIGDSAINYVSLIRFLAARGIRSCAINPPGYGTQADLPLPSFGQLMEEWAPAVCDAIPGPKILVGNSVGGALASAALSRPGVEGLVLVGWPVFVEALPQPWQLMPKTEADFDRLLEQSWYSPPPLGRSARRVLLERMSDQTIHDHAMSLDPVLYLEHLLSYSGPTLMVAGRNDGLVPVEAMERSTRVLANGKLSIIEECGHYPHREQVKIFGAEVINFSRAVMVREQARFETSVLSFGISQNTDSL